MNNASPNLCLALGSRASVEGRKFAITLFKSSAPFALQTTAFGAYWQIPFPPRTGPTLMRFVNLTRNIEIGANAYLLEIGGKSVVIDSGMHPKEEGDSALPRLDLLDGHHVETIFLSHAHLDHVGSLPVTTRRLPNSRVFMTEPTASLADAILHNSVNVMGRKKEAHDLPNYPLFTHRETDHQEHSWISFPLEHPYTLEGENLPVDELNTPGFRFHHAGHILGAVSIEFFADGKRLLYTSDVNFDDQTIMSAAQLPRDGIDTLIIETTRGDNPTPEGWTRKSEERRFAEALAAGLERGSVLVPVFALGKTQEVLAMVHDFRAQQWLPRELDIYIGGLSTKISTIYDRYANQQPRQLPGFQVLPKVAPRVLSGRTVGNAPIREHCLYAISSGMMTENTLSNVLARRFLQQERHSIFFVGYSDPQSPAGRLRAVPRGGTVELDPEHPDIPKRCDEQNFNFSAHATRESLLNYIVSLNPRQVLLVHGDQPAINWFQQQLQTAAPHMKVIIPQPGESIDLS